MSLIDYKKPFVIPPSLKQKFNNDLNYKNVSQAVIVKMKSDNQLTDRDLEIAKFLFNVRFATLNQIYRFLNLTSNKSNLKNRLDKLVKFRILNKFVLTNEDESIVEQLQIYCLDIGGRYLLASYSKIDTSDWYTSINLKASELIGENLLATEFYTRLKETCSEKISNFKQYPEFRCGQTTITPTFKFSLNIGPKTINFIGEVVREYDFPDNFREKSIKLNSLIKTNAWKKYYKEEDGEPILLILADSDETCYLASQTIDDFTQIDKFRLSTDERIKEHLSDKGTFLKFDYGTDRENKVLKLVKLDIFDR